MPYPQAGGGVGAAARGIWKRQEPGTGVMIGCGMEVCGGEKAARSGKIVVITNDPISPRVEVSYVATGE